MESNNYQERKKFLVEYFRSGEVDNSKFKLGMEIEHFIVKKDTMEAVPYYGLDGIEGILKEMLKNAWQGVYDNKNIIGLQGDKADISLEPGGQFELSLHPVNSLKEIDSIYKVFLNDISDILKERNLILLNLGYQPVTNIYNIPLLPKKRYEYMYRYFEDKGKYAHNMMKGTASIQLNIDYSSEEDFAKKMRVANFLSPFVYYFFDNSPFFEGKITNDFRARSLIWDNCDNARCGFVNNVFKKDFSYSDYADYILNLPSITYMKKDRLYYSGEDRIKDIFVPGDFSKKEMEHFLSMAFPEVRLKKYIELRSGDSLPYPYNLAYIAFLKTLLYNQSNLDNLYKESLAFSEDSILKLKANINNNENDIIIKDRPIDEYMSFLLSMVEKPLEKEEKKYLIYLEEIIKDKEYLKNKTLNLYNSGSTLKEALSWCTLSEKSARR
ncbi:MAG: glutamate--cysteine ligase [bacterium]